MWKDLAAVLAIVHNFYRYFSQRHIFPVNHNTQKGPCDCLKIKTFSLAQILFMSRSLVNPYYFYTLWSEMKLQLRSNAQPKTLKWRFLKCTDNLCCNRTKHVHKLTQKKMAQKQIFILFVMLIKLKLFIYLITQQQKCLSM